MKNYLFTLNLRYLVDLETLDKVRPEHIAFLKKYFDQGIFLAAGRQDPPTGGMIWAQAPDRKTIEKIIEEDIFLQKKYAEYTVFAFQPPLVTAQADVFAPFR